MILGSLKNTARIESMYPAFKPFFDYVKQNDVVNMDHGTVELDGDKLFVINTEIEGKLPDDAVLEGHRKYIDIQLLIGGSEAIGWKAIEDAKEVFKAYDEEKDLIFFTDEIDEIISLQPGQFMIFFPEDLHAPGIAEGPIRKLIAKVMV